MGEVISVTKDNYETGVKGSTGVFVLEFKSPVCPQCAILQPEFDKVAQGYGDRAGFGVVDVTKDIDIAITHDVRHLPVLLFFKNGEEAHRLDGPRKEEEIAHLLDHLLE